LYNSTSFSVQSKKIRIAQSGNNKLSRSERYGFTCDILIKPKNATDLITSQLIDENGMEVYSKYFSRLVVGNAPQIFPGSLNRTVANPGNYQLLVNEVRKVSHDVEQAGKIAESIETATEDVFRDFDLSTFMEHFKLDALEKTILALAVKTGTRLDLKTKGEYIPTLSTPP
jgi:CCR4-NOT transcription complex subunit 1